MAWRKDQPQQAVLTGDYAHDQALKRAARKARLKARGYPDVRA